MEHSPAMLLVKVREAGNLMCFLALIKRLVNHGAPANIGVINTPPPSYVIRRVTTSSRQGIGGNRYTASHLSQGIEKALVPTASSSGNGETKFSNWLLNLLANRSQPFDPLGAYLTHTNWNVPGSIIHSVETGISLDS